MLEFNREDLLKEVGEGLTVYGIKDIDVNKLNVLFTDNFVSVAYEVDEDIAFSVRYSNNTRHYKDFSSLFKVGESTFSRTYDIDKLENKEEDIYSYILNSEGYYGNKLLEEHVEEYKVLKNFESFNQCLADALLSLLGYADK